MAGAFFSHRRLSMSQRIKAAAAFKANVNIVLMTMHASHSLHCEIRDGKLRWWLTNGQRVPDGVAQAVVAKKSVVDVGAALFADVPSQTYRIIDRAPLKKNSEVPVA